MTSHDKKVRNILLNGPSNRVPYQDEILDALAENFTDGNCVYKGGRTWNSVAFNGGNIVCNLYTTDSAESVNSGIKNLNINNNITIIEAHYEGQIVDQPIYRIFINYTHKNAFTMKIDDQMRPRP